MVVPERQVDKATGQVTYRWNGGDDRNFIQGYGLTAQDSLVDFKANLNREALAGIQRRSNNLMLTARQAWALEILPEPVPEPTPKVGLFRRLLRRKT